MSLEDALRAVGRDDAARAALVDGLLAHETTCRFSRVRDEVTGPIVDALHADVDRIRKSLQDGLVFEVPYRSKIARDFVMSSPAVPDHVWEPQTTRVLVHLADRDAVVGGAYFGDQAIPLAKALGDRGTCHAYEPNAEQAEALAANVDGNDLRNVCVHRCGLWSVAGVTLRFVGSDAHAGAEVSDDGEGFPASTIDSLDAGVGLVSLDLEGGELHALRGAERTIRDHGPNIVFEVHRSYVDWSDGLPSTPIVRHLAERGYSMFAIRDFQSNVDLAGRPVEIVPIATAHLDGPPHGFNVLAVRDESVLDPFDVVPGVSPKLLLHGDPALHHPTGGL